MHCGKLLEEVGGWNSETMKHNAASQNISEFVYVLTFLLKKADNNITCCAAVIYRTYTCYTSMQGFILL